MILSIGNVEEIFANYEVTSFEVDGPMFIWRLRAPLCIFYNHVEQEWRMYLR